MSAKFARQISISPSLVNPVRWPNAGLLSVECPSQFGFIKTFIIVSKSLSVLYLIQVLSYACIYAPDDNECHVSCLVGNNQTLEQLTQHTVQCSISCLSIREYQPGQHMVASVLIVLTMPLSAPDLPPPGDLQIISNFTSHLLENCLNYSQLSNYLPSLSLYVCYHYVGKDNVDIYLILWNGCRKIKRN